jgi:hypothetical protein
MPVLIQFANLLSMASKKREPISFFKAEFDMAGCEFYLSPSDGLISKNDNDQTYVGHFEISL